MPENMSEDLLYDERLIERHLQRGLLTQESVEQRRQQAKDCTEQFQPLQVDNQKAVVQTSQNKD